MSLLRYFNVDQNGGLNKIHTNAIHKKFSLAYDLTFQIVIPNSSKNEERN